MKNKFKLTLVLKSILLISGIVISASSFAVTCTVDSAGNVATNCDTTLTINGSNTFSTINVQANITTTGGGNYGVLVDSTSTVLNNLNVNSGETISSVASGIVVISSTLGSLVNSGRIASSTANGVSNSGGVINSITNTSSGVIENTSNSSAGTAIANASGGTIGAINNYGIIRTASGLTRVAAISNVSNINTITNFGSISGAYLDIKNLGTIGTINNAQGAFNSPSSTSLTLWGTLPSNYNVIISSANYGTFSARDSSGVTTPAGATTFGVYAGSQITKSTYASVLTGFTGAGGNLTSVTGKYQGMTWTLVDAGGTQWDLAFSGTNTAVMSALNQTTTALQNAFTLQNTVLVNGFTYDCPVFDKNNVCVSVGARTTAVNTDSVNSTGGLLIGAYRLNNQVRMGAYIDQNISTNSTGIVKVANASPMVGVFGVWNERQDGTGTEVKVSAGYGQKNTTMTRPVVDGTEAGSGSSTLTSQGAQAIGKYGFAVADKTIVSPYVGLRYTQNNMGGYTEGSSASVTAPLTYSAINTNATTVVAGLGANYKVMPDVTLLTSAGLENDLSTSNGTYSATGLYGINPISFNSNPVRTRATASAGAYYDLAKNQRVSLNYIFRQEQFQGANTNAAFLTYAIGL